MASSGSDEVVNIKCCVCLEEKRTREAEKYCCECKDYYCSSCVEIHLKVPSMKGHKILQKSDFKTLAHDGSLPSFPTRRCFLHIAEVVNMYCEDHDEVACASCIALSHRSCKHVVSIPEDIDNLYKTVSLKDAKLKLSLTKKSMETIKKTGETKLIKLKRDLDEKIQAIKAFRQELQNLLDLMEQRTIEEIKREFYIFEASITKDINEAENLVTSLNEAETQLKKSEGNKSQEFVCVKLSQKLVANSDQTDKNEPIAIGTVSFKSDQSIKAFLQNMTALGEVTMEKPNSTVSISKPVNQTFTPKEGLYMVKKQREINVKLQDDKEICYIWGSCITEDDCLLLADNWNRRLKRMDLSADKVKDCIDLSDWPWDVCTVSKTEAAVSLGNQSVQLVSLGEKMTSTQTLSFNHVCLGIAHKDGKLLVTDNAETMYIYDLNGQEQGPITQDASRIDIFHQNEHIAVTAKGDKVFVADGNKGVIVLDSKGNNLFTMRDNNVSYYQGVCTDGQNVFVAGNESNNIVQFGHDFKTLGEIGKVSVPNSLCFYHLKRWLIATSAENNKITILELE